MAHIEVNGTKYTVANSRATVEAEVKNVLTGQVGVIGFSLSDGTGTVYLTTAGNCIAVSEPAPVAPVVTAEV